MAHNAETFSVGEFLDLINTMIGGETAAVRGEVTGAHDHQTGFYFSLKDADQDAKPSLMDCYMSPYAYHSLGIIIEDGMEVRVTGVPNIYKPKGRFSFRAQTIEIAGEGSLKKAYELLKKRLETEGLFARKRPLPEFIERIGVITSRSGAVIGDFRKNLLPLSFHIFLKDVRVEGAHAADQIVKAIQHFNRHMPDLDALVIIRGGGSLEDLQPFNNEHVARAIFSSTIPTIVGIGHDRDIPIASLVGDTMTSTPTACAMLINQSWDSLVRLMLQYAQGVAHSFERMLEKTQTLLAMDDALYRTAQRIQEYKQETVRYEQYLAAVNPERQLALGYSIVTHPSGKIVKSICDIRAGGEVETRIRDGSFISRVEKIK